MPILLTLWPVLNGFGRMPIYNVGGPVAWGLVVLASAWGLKAGRALASRRSRRSGNDDDVQLDERAPQPRLRQQLSATAIRMLASWEQTSLGTSLLRQGRGKGRCGRGYERTRSAVV